MAIPNHGGEHSVEPPQKDATLAFVLMGVVLGGTLVGIAHQEAIYSFLQKNFSPEELGQISARIDSMIKQAID